MICVPHMLARSISPKHLVNTFHLQDHHGRNTKISTTGGREYALESTHFPPGVRQKSQQVAAVQRAELCFPFASHAVRQLNSSKPQVLLVLISPRAWLCCCLPTTHFKVLTAILVALGRAPGEVTMCWRGASETPTAVFRLSSEKDHTVCSSVCQPVRLSASILSSPMCSVIFESIVQFQPKLIDNSKLMRSHAFHENHLWGWGGRSKCCCSELNSFLFLFGFQMANLHRCIG